LELVLDTECILPPIAWLVGAGPRHQYVELIRRYEECFKTFKDIAYELVCNKSALYFVEEAEITYRMIKERMHQLNIINIESFGYEGYHYMEHGFRWVNQALALAGISYDVADKLSASNEPLRKLERELSKFEILSILYWDTKSVLDRLYSFGIVHRKYHNITAVSSILDSLDTGRTRSLIWNGSDPGAYNLYEEDVNANRIVGAIDSGFDKMYLLISQELHKVQQNQYALYNAVQNSNKLLMHISLASHEVLDRVDSISNKMNGDSGWLSSINSGLSELSSEMYANTMAAYHSGSTNLEGLSRIEHEINRNTEILSIVNRDDWGYLRNYDGTAIYNY